MPHEIRIKQGDTLRLQLVLMDDGGVPYPLGAVTLASQVRTAAGDLVATLPIVPAGQTGTATIEQSTSQEWPQGTLRCDVKVTIGGVVAHSETFAIRVQGAVTP